MKSRCLSRVSMGMMMATLLVAVRPIGVAAADEFWQEVYNGNRVVEIQLTMTRDAWRRMQPRRATRRRGERGPTLARNSPMSKPTRELMARSSHPWACVSKGILLSVLPGGV